MSKITETDITAIIEEMHAQGLRMGPENGGESIDILTDTMESLLRKYEAVSELSGS